MAILYISRQVLMGSLSEELSQTSSVSCSEFNEVTPSHRRSMQEWSSGFRNSTCNSNALGMMSQRAFRIGDEAGRAFFGVLNALFCPSTKL